MRPCALCSKPTGDSALQESLWTAPEALERLARAHPGWRRTDGACPACLQQALLEVLLARGDAALHRAIQNVWPLDAEAAYGALPTPLRMHADPHYSGRGVTIALVDSAFAPHPDLARPPNRIAAWVDATIDPPLVLRFSPGDEPRWPEWDAARPVQWHGLMTSTVAVGNGHLSHGLYRSLAPDARVVLVQVSDERGRIANDAILRALTWLKAAVDALDLRVLSLSIAADAEDEPRPNPIDDAIADLAAAGVTVLAAAGNDGVRRLVPPATAPDAMTVGGIDDHNTLDHGGVALWHSNYGIARTGTSKPELVAPSLWVVAPLLPGSDAAAEAREIFAARARGEEWAEAHLIERRLVRPEYQLVEGTSFAAPLVASIVACMLEANPTLVPRDVRRLLLAAATPVPGAPIERQGAGAVDAGLAVALALRAPGGPLAGVGPSPEVDRDRVRFHLAARTARSVAVIGSWDGWRAPGTPAREEAAGMWRAEGPRPLPGTYEYKFLVDGERWLRDAGNPKAAPDGYGSLNSVLEVPVP